MVSVSVRAIFSSVVSANAGGMVAASRHSIPTRAAVFLTARVLLGRFDGSGSMAQDLREKLARPVGARRGEERLGLLHLHDAAAVHRHPPMGDAPRHAP